ncbi:MAG: L,D-transpeptidase family protein, partial [Epsilonproteobacteria bacterium]|nr:L,D-transpeptidase family protein [Campylobacterota bacterium]
MKRGVVAALSISLFLHGASIGKFADEASTILETKSKSSSPYFRTLYKDLFYVPIWVDENGLTKFGKNFIKEIDNDLTKSPSLPYYSDYIKLKRFLKRKNIKKLSTKDKIDLELKITSLYRKYMNYLIYGGINWRAFDRKIQELRKKYDYKVAWERYPPVVDSKKLLVESVMRGNLDYALNRAEPKRFKYRQLKKYLIKYLDIAKKGGWGKVPKTKTLKPGMSSKAILPIKRHLKLVGDIRGCSTDLDSTLYDQCLAKAVKRFKLRHGLRGNSIIDRQTRKALNIPASYKAKLIRLNLDRIKWFWHQEPRVRIELNIPAFRLYFYEGQNLINTMRVIVGKPDHPTPVFHNVMRYIVVNPYWKIPESIVKKEMLKHLIKDPYYYERQGKYLHKSWSEDSPRVDPGKVNWRKYYKNKKHIPYYFMQVPSAKNALGKIKFLFPKKYSVYINDTPTK